MVLSTIVVVVRSALQSQIFHVSAAPKPPGSALARADEHDDARVGKFPSRLLERDPLRAFRPIFKGKEEIRRIDLLNFLNLSVRSSC